jgi:hypothetical protein
VTEIDVSKLSAVEKRQILKEFASREKSKHLNKSVLEPTQRELQLAELLEDSLFPKQKAFFTSQARRRVGFCTRRAGKCLAEGTLVATPSGPRPIESLAPGDAIYGWNSDDTVSVAHVVQMHDQGIKDVVDLRSNSTTVATCTPDHVWLTCHVRYPDWRKQRAVKDFYQGCKIVRKEVRSALGQVHEPHAYALGALLGDGCGKGSGLQISSEDHLIPDRVAEDLGTHAAKATGENHTWLIKTSYPRTAAQLCHHYGEWCRGRLAHEKLCDLDIIKTWDRESGLAFLAGLLDTDGSVGAACGKRLSIRIAMQAKEVIDAVDYLLAALFMVTPRRGVDKRKRYKNGAVHQVAITNSTEAARILKALDPYIVTPRKKYRAEYEALAHINAAYTGVSVRHAGQKRCFDITVDNETNLYLLANGLITHNTIGAAKKFLINMLRNPTHSCLYLAQTAKAARLYMWKELKRLQIEHGLPFRFNETNLWMEHERGGGRLVLAGADKADEIEKFRGPNWMLAVLDEAASFGAHIENLIMEVIGPALRDHGGHLIMIGTAGKHKAGVFYEAAHGLRKRKSTGEPLWELHKWSLVDNPYLDKDARDLDLIMDEEGFSGPEDPRFKREYLGIWDIGDGERMFAYEPGKNDFDGELPGRHDWRYWAGVDFGWNDDSAICVVAWAPTSRKVYVVETWAAPRQYADDIASRLMELKSRFGITRIVGDCGGYGKGVAMQIQRDYGIYIAQARKTDKLSFVEFVNSAFLRGDIQIKRGDKLGKQLSEVSWNQTRTNAGNHERDDLVFSMVYVWRAVKDAGAGRKELEQKPTETPAVRREMQDKLETIKNSKPGRFKEEEDKPWYIKIGSPIAVAGTNHNRRTAWRDMLKNG